MRTGTLEKSPVCNYWLNSYYSTNTSTPHRPVPAFIFLPPHRRLVPTYHSTRYARYDPLLSNRGSPEPQVQLDYQLFRPRSVALIFVTRIGANAVRG